MAHGQRGCGGGAFEHILDHFKDIQKRGEPRGYLPDLTKSILVVSPRNVPTTEEFFQGMGVKIVIGSWYHGIFVGGRAAEENWLSEKVQGWEDSVKTLAGVACKHLQSAYAGL